MRTIAAALAAITLALIPAAASASTAPASTNPWPVTYTTSYAGYYGALVPPPAGQYESVYFQGTIALPLSSKLAKVTTGVTAEVRLTSPLGVSELQLGTDPETSTTWKPKMTYNGVPVACYDSSPFPQGDVVTFDGGVNTGIWTEDYPDIGIEFSDSAGRYADCETLTFGSTQSWFSTPIYSKIAIVDAFNVKGFTLPASPVSAASWSSLQVPTAAGQGFGSVTSSGQYIATSTGTKAGKVREQPGAYSFGAGGFTVTIP
jgi:hypothetical protein